MNSVSLSAWEKIGAATIAAVCLLPLVPYALASL